jgi:protein SHQ1
LNFSNPLLEDDDSFARYDPSSGYLTVTLTKEDKGQEFKDLDLLAKLLAPRPSAPQPLIEIIQDAPEKDDEDDLVAKTNALSLNRQEILEGRVLLTPQLAATLKMS